MHEGCPCRIDTFSSVRPYVLSIVPIRLPYNLRVDRTENGYILRGTMYNESYKEDEGGARLEEDRHSSGSSCAKLGGV